MVTLKGEAQQDIRFALCTSVHTFYGRIFSTKTARVNRIITTKNSTELQQDTTNFVGHSS